MGFFQILWTAQGHQRRARRDPRRPGPLALVTRAVFTSPAVFKPSDVLPAGFVAPCF
jgi:hypothetical protein